MRLRGIREDRKLSQQALARKAGVAQSTISEIESGKASPGVKVLGKLAAALQVPIADLLDDTM